MKQVARFFKLRWRHYTVLMRIDNEDERLALSKDKNELMRLSREGQLVEKPRDNLKSLLVLEFLGMAEDVTYNVRRNNL